MINTRLVMCKSLFPHFSLPKKTSLFINIFIVFQKSIENNLDTMAKSKYELINSQLSKLMSLHGEYAFLTCSNIFLNRGNYSLNLVSMNDTMMH